MSSEKPKLLLISFWYPPFQAVASNRTAALSKYMQKLGWEVHVVTATDSPYLFDGLRYPHSQVADEKILRIGGFSISAGLRKLSGNKLKGKGTARAAGPVQKTSRFKPFLYKCFDNLLCYPDESWPWFLKARRKVLDYARDIKPDLIISSSFPVTTHLLASRVAGRLGIPWIADYRDLWSLNHSRLYFFWMKSLHRSMEKKCLRNASACVTVSDPLKSQLEEFSGVKTRVIENGYDEDDYSQRPPLNSETFLKIIYTGMAYPGSQDIEPLFQAIHELEQENAIELGNVKLLFYGSNFDYIGSCAAKWHVEWAVSFEGQVPRQEIIQHQMAADILLFLKFNTGKGILTGKLFEYIGAGRPILAIGDPEDSVDRILKDTGLGFYPSENGDIKERVKSFVASKKAGRDVDFKLNKEAQLSFSRRVQIEVFDKLARELVDADL